MGMRWVVYSGKYIVVMVKAPQEMNGIHKAIIVFAL